MSGRLVTTGALAVMVCVLVIGIAPAALAQQRDCPAIGLLRSVVSDPTTYAPSGLEYLSLRLDWSTSQPLFRDGWVETNPAFTVTGRAGDPPVSDAEGKRRIALLAIGTLGESAVHNLAEQLLERALLRKYARHARLIRALGWAERTAMSSLVSYQLSASHLRQVGTNHGLARP